MIFSITICLYITKIQIPNKTPNKSPNKSPKGSEKETPNDYARELAERYSKTTRILLR